MYFGVLRLAPVTLRYILLKPRREHRRSPFSIHHALASRTLSFPVTAAAMRAAFLKQSEGQRDLVQEKPKAWVAVKLDVYFISSSPVEQR
jgi:hypothetical protein